MAPNVVLCQMVSWGNGWCAPISTKWAVTALFCGNQSESLVPWYVTRPMQCTDHLLSSADVKTLDETKENTQVLAPTNLHFAWILSALSAMNAFHYLLMSGLCVIDLTFVYFWQRTNSPSNVASFTYDSRWFMQIVVCYVLYLLFWCRPLMHTSI